MAKIGNKEACRVFAKQLVHLSKQKTRTFAVSSKVTSMSTQTKVMNSQMKMAGAMSTTAKVSGDLYIHSFVTSSEMFKYQHSNEIESSFIYIYIYKIYK